ncbi:MAG: (Fe-S)-binding protein [Deltaproteobacteria bacterium]|nr:(Fe-S)-binding protein [Deltaproteobacteria bacterium]
MEELQQPLPERLDLFTCIQCGKCTGGCPVSIKSPLNIRRVIRESTVREDLHIFFDRLEIWDCTTCSTCAIRCPRGLRPVDAIIGLREMMVEEGRIEKTIIDALDGAYKYGNPWGRAKNKRAEWAQDLEIPNALEMDPGQVLYFVCCAASYDPRVQVVAKSLVTVLRAAEVSFGILGNKEVCCGSEIRRMGEVGLFEMLMEENMKNFTKIEPKTIVTTSPHCMNALKNEYEGLESEVLHYSQFVWRLIKEGKLSFNTEVPMKVTYHDPCYLGKQNGVFDEPREVLKSIPGIELIEFGRCRENSLCCEGGGGRMWMEGTGIGKRLSEVRVEDALEMGVEAIITACPFCLLTLEDAVKTTGNEEKIKVIDLMELASMGLGVTPEVE